MLACSATIVLCMRSTNEAIHISVDHGGWSMLACGLLGDHRSVALNEVSTVQPGEICRICLAAAPRPGTATGVALPECNHMLSAPSEEYGAGVPAW
jgi:hypothetical protein